MNKSRVRTTRPVAKLRSGRNDWFRIENKTADTAEIFIYDEIGYFGVSAQDFVNQLKDVTSPRLDVHLNSPGGDVYDGIAIHTAISTHDAETTVYIDGLAASAASFIAMAGNRVVMAKNAELMIHDAFGLCIGNAEDMGKMVADLNRVSDNIASIYASRAGGSKQDWRALMLAETWFSADEAVAAGLADEILGAESEHDSTSTADSFDLSVFNYSNRADAPAPVTPEKETPFVFDPELFRAAFKEGVSA